MPSTNDSPGSIARTIRSTLSATPTTWEFVEAAQDYAISRARCGAPTTEIRLRLADRGIPPRVAAGLADVASRARRPRPQGQAASKQVHRWLKAAGVALATATWTAMTGWWVLPLAAVAASTLYLPGHSSSPSGDQPLLEIRRRTS